MTKQVFYSKERLAQIEAGYFELLREYIMDILRGKSNGFASLLDAFKAALINANSQNIEIILNDIKNSICETTISSPLNYSSITSKIIDFEGVTEKLCNVVLVKKRQNVEKIFKVLSDKNGKFKFVGVELDFGINDFWVYNERFLFVDNLKLHWQVSLSENYLFLGLHDPLTQKGFEVAEIEDIVRCEVCRNFMYNFSVEENKGNCVVKGCEGKKFWRAADTGFWTR